MCNTRVRLDVQILFIVNPFVLSKTSFAIFRTGIAQHSLLDATVVVIGRTQQTLYSIHRLLRSIWHHRFQFDPVHGRPRQLGTRLRRKPNVTYDTDRFLNRFAGIPNAKTLAKFFYKCHSVCASQNH